MEGVKRKRRGCRAVRKRKGRWGKKERGASRKEGKASRQGKEKKKNNLVPKEPPPPAPCTSPSHPLLLNLSFSFSRT